MAHHEAKQFKINGKEMWFHLLTDTSNVVLEKKAHACCWTGPSEDENDETSPREAIPGSRMRVEIHHHYTVTGNEASDAAFLEVAVTALLTFHATGEAKLTLPGGQVIGLETRA